MNVKTIFSCAACSTTYDDDYDAIHCCAPDENYKCACGKYHGGDYEAAELCCDNNENVAISLHDLAGWIK